MNVYKAFSTVPGRKEVLQSDTCLVSSGLYQLAMTVSKFSLSLPVSTGTKTDHLPQLGRRSEVIHVMGFSCAWHVLTCLSAALITSLSKLPAATASASFMILFSPSEYFRWIVFCFQTSSSTSKNY